MDKMPDYNLEKAEIDLQISQMEHNKKAQNFRKMQLMSEANKIDENLAATDVAIEELKLKFKEIGG